MVVRNRGALPWWCLAALLAAGCLLAAATTGLTTPDARFDWQPALAASQPWRAFTAALLHWSPQHLAMNLASLLLLAWLAHRANAGLRDAVAWGLAWPLTQIGLLARPDLTHYAGLSGVVHAGAAVLAWRLLAQRQMRPRLIGALLAAGLVVKLLSEQPWAAAVQAVPGWDFALAPWAHLSGALAGLCCAAVVSCWPDRPDTSTDATSTTPAR